MALHATKVDTTNIASGSCWVSCERNIFFVASAACCKHLQYHYDISMCSVYYTIIIYITNLVIEWETSIKLMGLQERDLLADPDLWG